MNSVVIIIKVAFDSNLTFDSNLAFHSNLMVVGGFL